MERVGYGELEKLSIQRLSDFLLGRRLDEVQETLLLFTKPGLFSEKK